MENEEPRHQGPVLPQLLHPAKIRQAMSTQLGFTIHILMFLLLFSGPFNDAFVATAQDTSAVDAVPHEKIEIARAAIDWVRDNHFVQPPPPQAPEVDTFRIDRNAIAIVEPGDEPGYRGGPKKARAHAKAVARAMGVPFDNYETFLNCTDPGPRKLRKCSFRKGIESYFSFEDLKMDGDEAQIEVVWSFIINREKATHRYTLRIERTGGTWAVQEVLRRVLQ